jgi:hypothetical protein
MSGYGSLDSIFHFPKDTIGPISGPIGAIGGGRGAVAGRQGLHHLFNDVFNLIFIDFHIQPFELTID